MQTSSFKDLKRNLKKDFTGLKMVKVAVLGDSATQMYVQAIRGYGFDMALNIEIYEADYDQIELQVFDSNSNLFSFKPDYVIVFYCINKLFKKYSKNEVISQRLNFAEAQINNINSIYKTLTSNLRTKVIFFNFNEINDSVFGNYANKVESSFLYQTRKINFELMNLSQDLKDLFVLDLNLLQGQYGIDEIFNNKIYINTELYFNIDFLPIIAKNTIDVIQSIEGKFKKCLILDLDNTVWGGIIGDDGIENIEIGDLGIGKAFTELQLWAKLLKQRGVILGVCSKNDEKNAKEPFEMHPEMILKLDDISIFIANWNNKADNIKYIQKVLNIGFDSIVFLDDNPFERNMVRSHVDDVVVPELPKDPAEYLKYIRTLNLFETASYTAEDEGRTSKYQVEAKRVIAQDQFTNETDFLQSLNMLSKVESFNTFNIPRVAQLTQRSNQFNLRTIRYTEKDIVRMSIDQDHTNLAFSLEDKYGDYGLISLVILKKEDQGTLFIDTWIMSCRVLKRDMENFVLNSIVDIAKEKGYNKIIGAYLPSAKNGIVKNHYKDLGFIEKENTWQLSISEFKKMKCFISKI